MIGIAVASRTNANTASTSAQLTTLSGVPVNRTDASSTRNTDSWLTSSAAARNQPRVRSSPTTRPRNRTADGPHPGGAVFPTSRRSAPTTRPATSPRRRADDSLRSASASTANVARKVTNPNRAAGNSSPVAWPVAHSTPSDTGGSSSLNDMFAMNVAIAESATSAAVNPHDAYIA